MRIMKFEGATMRDAVAKVKAELGDQAVIISSRQVRKGLLGHAVEISAAIDDDGDDRIHEPTPAPIAPSPAFTSARPTAAYGAPAVRGEDKKENTADVEKALAPLRSELKSLRAMVRSSDTSNNTKKLESEIAALRQLVEKMASVATSAPMPAAAGTISDAVAGLAAKRSRQPSPSQVSGMEAPLIAPSTARVVMLVGPTGAGKTTTIAKLAAHAALVEGRRVRLITLDTYRVGGVDQIRTFADLIGVPLTVLDRPSELEDAVDTDDDLVLVDTAGRSPKDTAAIVELATAIGSLPEVEVHLAIPAMASAQQIDELVTRYTALQPSRLLFTKLDEQDAVPQLLEAPRRTRLPITWVTTGQQVPEDLEQPTAQRLGQLAATGISAPATARNRKAS